MRIRKLLSVCFAAAMFGSLFSILPPAQAAPSFEKILTVSAPNTPTGCAAPFISFDTSQAPFNQAGPFMVTGYYKCRKDGVMYKDGMNGGSANVFGISVEDTNGQWKEFKAYFGSADSLTFKGIDLWYMAGELSVAGVKVVNTAGQVVYDMESDPALTAMQSAALARKGIWYFFTYSSHPDFLFTVTAPEAPIGLVEGSSYALTDNVLSGVSYGTDVLTVRSNFTRSDRVAAYRGGKKLTDSATVTPDTTFIYNKGKADSVTFTLAPMTGDHNGDGKIDIRDLRIAKETGFGDLESQHSGALDINGDGNLDKTDFSRIRGAIAGQPLYANQSVSTDALLHFANPVGRLHKDNNMLLMEHSASNFTLTGRLRGDVTATVWAERTANNNDPIGLFIEVDGKMRFVSVPGASRYATITLAEDLTPGKHTIRVYKSSDAAHDLIGFSAVHYNGQLSKTAESKRRIEFLGDSITAGADVFPDPSVQRKEYGALTSYYSYAKKTADLLGASHYSVANSGWRLCYSLYHQYTIRSVYPYQSMRSAYEGGEYDFDWAPQAVVINLGTNDRFTAGAFDYATDVQELLALVREKNPDAAIFWVYGAMDSFHESNTWIKDAVDRFAATDGNTYYVPLPQNSNGAYGHPDEAGQQQHATIIANAISSVLGW